MKNNFVSKVIKLTLALFSIISTSISMYQFISGENVTSLIMICVAFIFVLLYVIITYKNLLDDTNRFKRETGMVYHKYSHLLRDTFYDLHNIISSEHYNTQILDNLLASYCNKILDIMTNYFIVLLNQVGSLSIKCIDKRFWDNNQINNNKEDIEVYTVARCVNSHHNRQRDDSIKHRIGEYTPFIELFINQKSDYHILNIRKNERKLNYKTGNPDWNIYYNNQIIVPIRIKKHIIEQGIRHDSGNNVIGFIIYDYNGDRRLSETQIKNLKDYMKIFSNSSYIIFDILRKHYNK